MKNNNEKSIFAFILNKRKIVLIFVAFIIIYGIDCYNKLPKQQYPIINTPAVIITSVYPGASATDMEQLVTKKIEEVAMSADGYDYCSSESYNSTSITKVFFDLNISSDRIEKTKEDLRFKILALKDNKQLPSGVTHLNYNADTGNTEGLFIAFTSPTRSNEELYQRANDLKDILRASPGIKDISVFGKSTEKINVTVDIDKLNTLGLSLAEICTLIDYQNSMIPIGNIEFLDDKITVNSSGKFENISEIENLVLDVSKTNVTCLKDVATIEKIKDENDKSFNFNGKPTILLSVSYQDNINIVKNGKQLLSTIDEFKNTLPSDISIDKVVDLSSDVSKSINEFTISVLQSIIIVLVVVILGMNIRNGGIVAVAIPVSILVPFLVMKIFGIDIQFMSLAALIISLGMLVDNAIVVSDAIQVRFDNGDDRFFACVNGTREVYMPVLSSTLTTVSIFIMIYFLPGTMFSFANSLPTIIITALFASYIVSITVTPIMCFYLMKKTDTTKNKKVSLLDKVANIISNILNIALKHEKLTIFIGFLCLLGSLVLLLGVTVEFLPKSDKTLLDIHIETDNLNDIRKTKQISDLVTSEIANEPEVLYYLSVVGGNLPKYDFSFMPDIDGLNKSNIVIGVDLKKGGRFKTNEHFVKYLQDKLTVPNSNVTVNELNIVPTPSKPIQLQIVGDDFDILNNAAEIIEQELFSMGNVEKINSTRQIQTKQYFIDTKDTPLNTYGLTKAGLLNELNIAMMGRDVSVFRKDTIEYPIHVKSNISSTEDLSNFMIKSNNTKHPLKQVADVVLKSDYESISRYNGKRAVTIMAYPSFGNAPIAIQRELVKSLSTKDLGNVSLVYEGDAKQMGTSIAGLMNGLLIGVSGIILVLYMQFYSIKKVVIVLVAIPFGIVGASIGLFLLRPGFNLFTILGILSLFGVVVNNSIVLVDYIDSERANGVSVIDACKSAVDRRFRPIYLSTVTTVLGMIPLALGKNLLFTGLSITFMFGLALCMFFTLIMIPVVYHLWEKNYCNKDI